MKEYILKALEIYKNNPIKIELLKKSTKEIQINSYKLKDIILEAEAVAKEYNILMDSIEVFDNCFEIPIQILTRQSVRL